MFSPSKHCPKSVPVYPTAHWQVPLIHSTLGREPLQSSTEVQDSPRQDTIKQTNCYKTYDVIDLGSAFAMEQSCKS